MSDGYFKIKSKKNIEQLEIGDRIETSDFATLTPAGNFVQLEYVEEESKLEPTLVHPGIFAIKKTMAGLKLYETSFSEDKVLESFIQTKDVTDKIDCFFNRLHVYKKRGIEVPIRRMLLYGPAGTGKTTILSLSARKYSKDNETLVLVWHTDKFEAHQVKDFIKSFEYVGIKKMILIVEDIGGVEMKEQSRGSESSLLSLLDNQERTFNIATMIIGTTNYPHVFQGNLTNRPGRFADKIEITYPEAKAKKELLKFFAQGEALTEEELSLMDSGDCKQFTADHLKEVFIRSDLYDKSVKTVILELAAEIKKYNNSFAEKSSRMGILSDDY